MQTELTNYLTTCPWHQGHGASEGHLGMGMLYFAIPYMLQAELVVCVGSGGGFVPLCMRSAQRLYNPAGKTILVDNFSGKWGGTVWEHPDTYPRTEFPDVDLWVMDSAIAAKRMWDKGMRPEYIHIDADHSRSGCLADWRAWSGLLHVDGIITMHDIYLKGVAPVIALIERSTKWEVLTLNIGAGLAMVKRKYDAGHGQAERDVV